MTGILGTPKTFWGVLKNKPNFAFYKNEFKFAILQISHNIKYKVI